MGLDAKRRKPEPGNWVLPKQKNHILVNVDGRSAFRINGVIKGEVQGLKNVDLIYAPLGDNRLLEVHLTRNADHPQNPELERAFNLIISTIKFVR